MGYYVYGNGHLTIEHDKVDNAYIAMIKLNQNDGLKYGGSWGGRSDGITSDDPRPEGMSYHPAKWFSWMDADYPSKCKDMVEVLEALGFEVQVENTTNTETTYSLTYDQKIGQEDLFLGAIAPFVKVGTIEWQGEDGAKWKLEFADGVITHKTGYTVYR